jgi:hypothetical protein
MKGKMAKSFGILAIITTLLVVSGCLFSSGHTDVSPAPAATGTPQPPGTTPTPTHFPGFNVSPGTTWAWTPGTDDSTPDNYTELFPTPAPGANGTDGTNRTGSPTPSPQPVLSGTAKDWGTSKDTYARGDTATGWVYVTNTGNVPIDTVNFVIVIKRTVFFVPIEKSYDYSKTGLNIRSGETQRVEFSQLIPSEYSGMSTAGDYQFKVTAKLAGNDIGSFSKSMKVV